MGILRRGAALFLLLTLGAGAAAEPPASPERAFLDRLPLAWCGIFRWDGDAQEQRVTLAFPRFEQRADGRLEADGPGILRSYRIVPFRMRAVVDPATRRVEMFEALDIPMSDYVTDGSHVGELAADLQSMRLVWTTRGTGKRGAMELFARPATADLAQPCGPPSS